MATNTWSCLCGSFQGEVTGDPKLAVYCHCKQCRQYSGTAMQLAIWGPESFKVLKGDDNLIAYESAPGIFRKSCKTCGAFAYKTAGPDTNIVPIGAMDGPGVKPTCHIFVGDKAPGAEIPVPELPQHDKFP